VASKLGDASAELQLLWAVSGYWRAIRQGARQLFGAKIPTLDLASWKICKPQETDGR
jgi:hypothetical protein